MTLFKHLELTTADVIYKELTVCQDLRMYTFIKIIFPTLSKTDSIIIWILQIGKWSTSKFSSMFKSKELSIKIHIDISINNYSLHH